MRRLHLGCRAASGLCRVGAETLGTGRAVTVAMLYTIIAVCFGAIALAQVWEGIRSPAYRTPMNALNTGSIVGMALCVALRFEPGYMVFAGAQFAAIVLRRRAERRAGVGS